MNYLNVLKAFQLHCSKDTTRSTLTGIYVEPLENTFNLVATSGYTLLLKEFSNDEWERFSAALLSEFGTTLPETPTTGWICLDKKMRGICTRGALFASAEEMGEPYPRYRHVIPSEFSNNPEDLPTFGFEVLTIIQKTYKLLGFKKPYFKPEKWNTIVGATLTDVLGFTLLVMPVRILKD